MTGDVVLGRAGYGKSGVRLVKVVRGPERHDLIDLDVAVALEGNFDAAHLRGDNTDLLATDTMRNTVYALAKNYLEHDDVEEFGLTLVDHFLKTSPTVERATIRFTEFPWGRIRAEGRDHPHSFVRDAGERLAEVSGGASGDRSVEAGLGNLLIMKTTASGWEDFFRDRYTTLPDTDDRILATVVNARWTYTATDLDFGALWTGVRDRILTTFTDHYSPSMQNTLYRIGKAVLEDFPEVEKIHLSFPNKHHLLYDLSRFGIENENETFQATQEPYGLIEGTVERKV